MKRTNWDIYKITSPSGKIYIGKTSGFKKRISYYKNNSCKGQTRLFSSFKKYGFDSHEIKIIDSFIGDAEVANSKEMFWIRSYMTNFCKWPEIDGLNLTNGGEGTIGYKATNEQKKKLSELHTKNPSRGRLGKHCSDEQKKKLRDCNLGRPNYKRRGRTTSDITKSRQSLARIGKPNPYTSKLILQFSLDGVFLNEYSSMKQASEMTGIDRCSIRNIAKLKIKNPHKFIFKYK